MSPHLNCRQAGIQEVLRSPDDWAGCSESRFLSRFSSHLLKKKHWPELDVDVQQSCTADLLQASLQKLLLPPCCSVNNFQGCQSASSFALLTAVPEKPYILGPFL